MFSQVLFNRLMAFQKRTFCSGVAPKQVSHIMFGDIRMPDKLYKSIELEIKSCEKSVLQSYQYFVKTAAQHLNISVKRVLFSGKPSLRRFTVLKSVHVYRKHLVQYEIRTHYVWIHLNKLTGSTADTFLEYIQRMLPEGVALKVTKVSVEPLPVHLKAENIRKVTGKEPSS